MDIALLKTFLEVARTRHFGKAADRLFLTQSAVSARIKLLEDRLGVVLFERRRNDIRLTEAGERLLRHAEGVVRAWERARQDMSLGQGDGQALQVGVGPDLWRLWANGWAARVTESEPELGFRFDLAPGDVLTERLNANALDLVFLIEPPQLAGVVYRQVLTLPLIMVSSVPDLDYREAARRGYWYVYWGLSFAVSHEALFEGVEMSHRTINSGEAALEFILEHGGSAYVPVEWAGPLINDGRIFKVDDAPEIERFGFAVWRPDSSRATLVERLIGL